MSRSYQGASPTPGGLLIFGLLRDGAYPVARAQDVLDLIYRTRVCTVA